MHRVPGTFDTGAGWMSSIGSFRRRNDSNFLCADQCLCLTCMTILNRSYMRASDLSLHRGEPLTQVQMPAGEIVTAMSDDLMVGT